MFALMANWYMFDVNLKGQSPADYQQIACVEQMDNDYVFGEKQRGDGGKSCRKKKILFFFKWPGTSRQNEYICHVQGKSLTYFFKFTLPLA